MQIRAIVLYSPAGAIRTLPFRLNAPNIITGRSKTGKTALLHIIDYCCGRGECLIPRGVIRDHVAWYALLLQFPETQVFVARRNPPANPPRRGAANAIDTSPDVYHSIAANILPPTLATLVPNITVDGLTDLLTQMNGIAPNEHIPAEGHTRLPLRGTIDHAKFLLFQSQNDIQNEGYLFHRQNEEYIPNAIRDTLPYFLGAVPDDTIQIRARLRERRLELQRLNRSQAEAIRIATESSDAALGLLTEAVSSGLTERPATNEFQAVVASLRSAMTQQQIRPPVERVEVVRLQDEQVRLRGLLQSLQSQQAQARAYNAATAEYSVEATVQAGRLEAINLLGRVDGGTDQCPLCQNTLETPVPAVSDLRDSLTRLQNDLEGVTTRRPRVDDRIAELEAQIGQTRRELVIVREAIAATQTVPQADADDAAQRGYVRGRISMFLDNLPTAPPAGNRAVRIEELTAEIAGLEESLTDETERAEVDSILTRISRWMTKWAEDLKMEWQPNQHRLDISLLTVVAETEPRSTRMIQMGGAENWLGCHLIAHMALHRWFSQETRPVPRFLYLDQLTGAFYPPESEAGGRERALVHAMYKWLFAALEESENRFQLIIVDHADLNEQWFQDAVVEKWWGETDGLIQWEWRTGIQRMPPNPPV